MNIKLYINIQIFITFQANVKEVTSVHCPQCKMVTALIGNGMKMITLNAAKTQKILNTIKNIHLDK